MKKTWLISSALGGMIIAGSVALAATAAPAGKQFRADANSDGNVTKAELAASLDKRFAELDQNGDGKVTKEERDAVRRARFDKHFAEMDKDGNGQVSKAEMQAAHEARRQGREARRGKPGADGSGGPGMHHRGMRHGGMSGSGLGGRMTALDANSDGVVTKAEFQAKAIERFDRVDANKDGTITPTERQAARESMKKRPQDRPTTPSN